MERAVRPARHPPAPGRHGHHVGRGAWPWPAEVGYPVLVRPTYVLGGRAMEIVYDDEPRRGDGGDVRLDRCGRGGSLGGRAA